MFDGQHFLVAFVLFSGALAWHCPAEPSSEGPPNLDCVKVKHGCGKLVLTNEQGRETVFPGEQDPRRTRPCIGFRDGNGVKSATVEGPGCYYIYERKNFRGAEVKIYDGLKVEGKNKRIMTVKSIEFFLGCEAPKKTITNHTDGRFVYTLLPKDNNNNNNKENNNTTNTDYYKYNNRNRNSNRYFLGGAMGLSALSMIAVVLLPVFRKLKTSEAQEVKQSDTEIKNTEINNTRLWSEIVDWRENIQRQETRKAILLGLLPSVLDVSSDYSYARTWNDEGFNSQIRALIYFFICLPHVVTLLTSMLRILASQTFTCSESRLSLRILTKTAATLLFLSLLVGFIYGALFLGWYHPDVYAYLAFVSAVITVGLKTFGVLVQGPEMTKAMALVNARKVDF